MQPICHLYIPKKALARLTSNIKYIFPEQNSNVLSGIIIFCRVQYKMQTLAVNIGNNILYFQTEHEITLLQEIHIVFPDKNYKDGPLILVSKVYI